MPHTRGGQNGGLRIESRVHCMSRTTNVAVDVGKGVHSTRLENCTAKIDTTFMATISEAKDGVTAHISKL